MWHPNLFLPISAPCLAQMRGTRERRKRVLFQKEVEIASARSALARAWAKDRLEVDVHADHWDSGPNLRRAITLRVCEDYEKKPRRPVQFLTPRNREIQSSALSPAARAASGHRAGPIVDPPVVSRSFSPAPWRGFALFERLDYQKDKESPGRVPGASSWKWRRGVRVRPSAGYCGRPSTTKDRNLPTLSRAASPPSFWAGSSRHACIFSWLWNR